LQAVQREIEAKGMCSRLTVRLLRRGQTYAKNRTDLTFTGRKSRCVIADVSVEADVQRMVSEVVEHFGELNVGVNRIIFIEFH